MEIFLLYLLTRLDALNNAAIVLAVIFGVSLLTVILFGTMEKWDCTVLWAKRLGIAFAVCFLATVVIPTKKDALFIVAGVGVVEAARSESAKRIASKSVRVIEEFLDAYLKKNKAE